MGGAAYTARGASTGQAPTTVFFGPVPDKYNMLLGFYSFDTGSSHGVQFTSTKVPATNINTWVPWDANWGGGGGSNITASIGAATTAPDGTNTGHHVTEGTNTGYHVMVAGCDDNGLLFKPARRRLSVFAKAAERTRCWLQVGDHLNLTGAGNRYEAGVRCVFDLAGGQIGVPVAANNTGPFPYNFAAVGAGMIPFGNGWYLCYIDVSLATNAQTPFNSSGCLQSIVGPDSGSGTGAISNSYVGNGTSGIYVWNTNMLPPRAYGMNTVTYFSDLLSISEVDVNNTLAPGFKWYVAGATWPGITYFGWPLITPGTLTVSGSVMTVPFGGGTNPNVTSAAYTSGTNFVGYAAAPPFVLEWNGHFDYAIRNPNNSDELAWWMMPIEYIIKASNVTQTGPDYQEIDTVDSGVAGAFFNPIFGCIDDSQNTGGLHLPQADFQMFPFQGGILWASAFTYNINQVIGFNGVLYQSLINSNVGNQPDISPADWSIFTPSPPDPPTAGVPIIDFNAFHTWTLIRIPDRSQYSPFDDTGIMMFFFDGRYTMSLNFPSNVTYGSSLTLSNANNMSQTRDGYHWMWIVGSGNLRNIYTDYVRTTQ